MAEAPAPDAGLRRAISGRMLIVFIVGDILGAGIYALVGKLAGQVGGTVWLPLAIGFVVAALTAASYAELVGKYPRAAGAALYAHRAFKRPFLTFLIAFAVMMSGIASASAAALAFGGNYLAQFISAPPMLAALGFLAMITLINFIGISESIKVNLVLTIVEVTGLVIVIVVGVIGIAQGTGEPSRVLEMTAPNGAVLGVLGATALGFYALIGFEDSVNLAEECEEPHRTFPVALFLGITITGVIYLAVSFIAVVLVPPATLATSSGPLLEVVNAAGVQFPPKLFAIIALLAIGNTALINMIMASRLLYGMANENIVPRAFGRVHATRNTPVVAIGFTVVISCALIASGTVRDLAETTVLLLLLVFAIVNIAVLVLKRRPVEHPHFTTPRWAPVLGAITTLVLASPLSGRAPRVYLVAGILVGVGAVLWGLNRLITGTKVTEIDAENLVK
ncbi:MAG: amino acid permease-associated region [Myxococcales bacterium]|nr:amino acid permease-associated region [Myxococcales bacterium]